MHFNQILFIFTFVTAVVQSSLLRISNRIDESNIEPYITNGRNAMDGEAPWQVALQNNLPNYLCGGAILTEEWIVTAAQCTSELLREGLYVRYNTLKLSGGISVQIKYIFQHSYYNSATHENDISLIMTASKMTLNQTNANPVQFAAFPLFPTLPLNITGWGSTIYSSMNFSDDLQISTLTVSDPNECNNTFGGKITTKMFCAKSANSSHSCATPGDRGGPGVNLRKLHGIMISWEDCEQYQGYNVFTNFFLYYDWVILVISSTLSTTTESAYQ